MTSLLSGATIISVADAFDIQNDFPRWSGRIRDSLPRRLLVVSAHCVKLGFGSLRRKAILSGSTVTSIDGNNATDPQRTCLFDRQMQERFEDDTFGWVTGSGPHVGLADAIQNFDVTVRLSHRIAMSDALQVVWSHRSRSCEVNLADTGVASPSGPNFRYEHLLRAQGMHFGLSYIY